MAPECKDSAGVPPGEAICMFNKKKKHFNNNNRPHYTRQNGGPMRPPMDQTLPKMICPRITLIPIRL